MSSKGEPRLPSGVGATQVADSLGGHGVIRGGIRSRTPGLRMFGPAYTLRLRADDNLGLHRAIRDAAVGDVIVASVEGKPEYGMWGELMTVAASNAGLAGLVTDGSVRDVATLAGHGFPVFSAGVDVRATAKATHGSHQQPIEIGGATVKPGDYLVGDDDGVIAVPSGELENCLSRAREIANREGHLLQELARGASLFELMGLSAADDHGGDEQ